MEKYTSGMEKHKCNTEKHTSGIEKNKCNMKKYKCNTEKYTCSMEKHKCNDLKLSPLGDFRVFKSYNIFVIKALTDSQSRYWLIFDGSIS